VPALIRLRWYLALLLLISLVFFSLGQRASFVRAQETSITLTPAIVEIAVNPEDTIERFLQIKNTGDASLPVTIEVKSAVIDNRVSDVLDSTRYDVSEWVTFSEETYLFAPNQVREIPFVVTVPANAGPGGHYASISVRALALEQAEGSDTRSIVFPEVSVPVFITVSGDVQESARVAHQDLSPLFMTRDSAYNSQIVVENTGTVHNLVAPVLELRKGDTLVASYKFVPAVILPGTQKIFTVSWQSPTEYGSYQTRVVFPVGSDRIIVESSSEALLITPPPSLLIMLAIFTWVTAYLMPYRKNIRSSIRVLFGKT